MARHPDCIFAWANPGNVRVSRLFAFPTSTIAGLTALLLGCAGASSASPQGPGRGPAPRPTGSAPTGSYGAEAAVSLTPLEAGALEAARARLAQGTRRPELSQALTRAARILARRATSSSDDPLGRSAVRDALAAACSYDPAPSAFLARASPSHLQQVIARAITPGGATHLGAGVIESGGEAVAVILASNRSARLDPFPSGAAVGGEALLSGELLGGLHAPRVYVTVPSGQVQEREVSGTGAFQAHVPFTERGRYVVELVAEGPSGPTVAALLVVAVGGAALEGPRTVDGEEPAEAGAAEARVVAALSALRVGRGLSPLTPSADLAAVARRHSAAMRASGKVAHVVPGSPGPAERLLRADIGFARVYENVAAARTALAAQDAAVESPAHLKNMLEPAATRVGVGIAREVLPSGDPRVYLTEIFVEPPEETLAGPLNPEARVRAALWSERARLGLPPLTADAALDQLAREGADEFRRRDAEEVPDLAPRALALRRALAAADAFVASGPGEATRSRNLRDARFRRVGVGVIEATSRRFGFGRLFIAVIYTD